MAPLRHTFDFVRQIWYAIDTASALQHGVSASEKAQRYTMATSTPQTQAA